MAKKQVVRIAKGKTPKGCVEEVFTTEDLEGGGGKCPDGTYGFEIKKVELKEGNDSGEEFYNFTWRGFTGAATGKIVYDTLSLQASVAWRRRLYLQAMGYELKAGQQYHIDWEALVGEQACLEIVTQADNKYPDVKEVHSIKYLDDLAVEPAEEQKPDYDDDVPDDFGAAGELREEEPGVEEVEEQEPPTVVTDIKTNSRHKVTKKPSAGTIDIGQRVEFDTDEQEDGEDVIVTLVGTVTSMNPFNIVDDDNNDYEGWTPEEVRVI